MAGYANIGGVWTELKPLSANIGGVWTEQKTGYANIGGVWTEIYKSAIPLSSLPEGTLLKINENGVGQGYYLVKHNYESGLNGAGRTLVLRKNTTTYMKWNSTANNNYSTSSANNWLNTTFKGWLDAGIRNAMGTTRIYYSYSSATGDSDDPYEEQKTTMGASAFLLSCTEYGTRGNGIVTDTAGTTLPVAQSVRAARQEYWTRSPNVSSADGVFYVQTSGATNMSIFANKSKYMRPAFTLPATIAVNPEPNADGSYTVLA